MASWTITYDDGSVAHLEAETLAIAIVTMPEVPEGRLFVTMTRDPDPTPPALTAAVEALQSLGLTPEMVAALLAAQQVPAPASPAPTEGVAS
ncbi:hypothetical protein [Pseudolysinimonas sp.]|uniref:hypothetical protein n=1 Tax=Pseudolysinimonas sp. TaxID=2680009 RepID=UPI003F802F64